MKPFETVAYVIDPRLPGGTSSAVAAELTAVSDLCRIEVHAVASQMFEGQQVAPQLADALDRLGLDLIWDAPAIHADTVILHNPAFLKFQQEFGRRIVARHLIVVAHENFLRPGGEEGFDVRRCLDQLDRATVALEKTIAPISPYNRATITSWFSRNSCLTEWNILRQDWFNVCSFEMCKPNPNPTDRRGRHSRPGFEKFPSLPDMEVSFPRHASSNVILGADILMSEKSRHPHWKLFPFRGLDLPSYFEMFDFMVYFTAPTWRESFGRVLAEAIGAGKVVIADRDTGSAFGDAVVSAIPSEVDSIIERFIADPKSYTRQVTRAQAKLASFSSQEFRKQFKALAVPSRRMAV